MWSCTVERASPCAGPAGFFNKHFVFGSNSADCETSAASVNTRSSAAATEVRRTAAAVCSDMLILQRGPCPQHTMWNTHTKSLGRPLISVAHCHGGAISHMLPANLPTHSSALKNQVGALAQTDERFYNKHALLNSTEFGKLLVLTNDTVHMWNVFAIIMYSGLMSLKTFDQHWGRRVKQQIITPEKVKAVFSWIIWINYLLQLNTASPAHATETLLFTTVCVCVCGERRRWFRGSVDRLDQQDPEQWVLHYPHPTPYFPFHHPSIYNIFHSAPFSSSSSVLYLPSSSTPPLSPLSPFLPQA